MANSHIRRVVISRLESADREAREAAAAMGHAGLKGRVREIAMSKVFSPFLPAGFDCGTGKITDCLEHRTNEIDVIVFDRRSVPSFLFDEKTGLFPVEACAYAVEVKSTLTATEVKDAVGKGENTNRLKRSPSPGPDGTVIFGRGTVCGVLFAFDSDLTSKTELERYAEIDPNWATRPMFQVICVLGRGYWRFGDKNVWHEQIADPKAPYEELVGFLTGFTNTLCAKANRTELVDFSHYLDPKVTIIKRPPAPGA